jgi:type III secretory pathway component EscV
MRKQVSTALALILALGAAPVMAQDTAPSNETTTEAETSTEAETPATETETTTEGEVTTETPTTGETTTETGTEVEVEVTPEQETEIHDVVVQENVDKVEIDFDLSVGVAVPPTITLHPVPVRVIELVPAYEGFMFFLLADGRIVIVDPGTMQVVLILAA